MYPANGICVMNVLPLPVHYEMYLGNFNAIRNVPGRFQSINDMHLGNVSDICVTKYTLAVPVHYEI